MEVDDQERPFLSIKEFGELMGVKPARANTLAHQLGIAIRVGERRLLVPRAAVEALGNTAVARARAIATAGLQPAE